MTRHPREWAQSAICAAALVTLSIAASAGHRPAWAADLGGYSGPTTVAEMAAVSVATGESKFHRLIVFGDSYADMTLSDQSATNPLAPTLPPGVPGLMLWRVYPVSLKENLGIPEAHDVAVGGATASPSIGPPSTPPGLNLPQQVGLYLATNPAFGPRDLITINIGGNDIREILGNTFANNPDANLAAGYPKELLNPLNAKAFADTTTGYVASQIDLLVKAGGQNFVLGGFSAISQLPELKAAFDQLKAVDPQAAEILAKSADDYARAHFLGLQTALAPYANDGARFFLFDLARLAQAVQADPARYGFTGGFICPKNELPSPPGSWICGATRLNPTNLNELQDKYYFGPDGLHLTNGGFKLVADYMANIVMAPDTIAVQPGLALATTSGFTQSVLGRLDAVREARAAAGVAASASADGRMSLGAAAKARAPEAPASDRFMSYAMGTFLGGNRSDSADVVGYDYDSRSGTAGIEYSINRNLIFGIAGNYTTTSADLTSDANVDLDSIQGAAYLSYATRQVFADALVAYGAHDIGLTRPGVIDTIRSSTDASALAVAARAGYLFELGGLRAGPVAGLTYIRARVDGYAEQGDDLLTYNVSAQTLESLAGNLGIRFLAPFQTGGGTLVIPHLNVLLEHQFGDDTRTLTAALTQAPMLPIPTTLPNFESRTYGRVEGGVTVHLSPDLSATVAAGSTFARDDGEDYRVSAGLNYRF